MDDLTREVIRIAELISKVTTGLRQLHERVADLELRLDVNVEETFGRFDRRVSALERGR